MLTALVTTPPVSAARTCCGGDDAGAVLRLLGRGAEVRRDDDVVALEDRMPGEGLGGEDVERGARDLPGLEAGLEGLEVDELAAGAVDDAHPVAHRLDRLGVDPVDRLRGLRQVDRDQVGAGIQLLARVDALDAELAEALRRDELVEGDDVHVEGLGAPGDELADATEPDHPDRLPVELVAAVARTGPLAGDERAVRLGDVAEQRQRHRDRVLGGRDRVRLGGVGDHDPALGRGGEVHVVDAGAGAPDRAQALGAVDQVSGQLRSRADQDRVELADPLGELLVGPIEAELDVELLAQEVDAGLGDLLLDQDLWTIVHGALRASSRPAPARLHRRRRPAPRRRPHRARRRGRARAARSRAR